MNQTNKPLLGCSSDHHTIHRHQLKKTIQVRVIYKSSLQIFTDHPQRLEVLQEPWRENWLRLDSGWTCGSHRKQCTQLMTKEGQKASVDTHQSISSKWNDQRPGRNTMKLVTVWLELLLFLQFGPSLASLLRTPGILQTCSLQTRLFTQVSDCYTLASFWCLHLSS